MSLNSEATGCWEATAVCSGIGSSEGSPACSRRASSNSCREAVRGQRRVQLFMQLSANFFADLRELRY